MHKFLVIASEYTSEWINNFGDLQDEMNKLEKNGVVSNVRVQQFKDNVLLSEIKYNFNGAEWEKTSA